jgi:uncharacterized protein with von Willebrand factor type A (vWA) domain
MRTIAHLDAVTPTTDEMDVVAAKFDIYNYCPTLVIDMFNMLTGGTLTSVEYMQQQCIDNIDYEVNVQSFLEKVPSLASSLSGSPLEQVFNILELLANGETGDDNSNSELTLPIFNNNHEVRKKVKSIKETVKSLGRRSADEKLLLSGEISYKLAEVLRASDTLDKLGIIDTSNTMIADSTGEYCETRPIRGFDELNLINPIELINPVNYLSYRIINNESHIIERYRKEDKLSFITLICDVSGSMQRDNKMNKALGIIFNIIKRVQSGECELLFSYFERTCFDWYHVTKDSDVTSIWNAIYHTSFDKGGTDVQRCIKEAISKSRGVISTNKQLIVINDGQDECNLTLPDLDGFKLHSFILDSSNYNLQKLSIASGGTYRNHI